MLRRARGAGARDADCSPGDESTRRRRA